MLVAVLVMVLASSMVVLRPVLAAWSSARRRREVFSSAACRARREWHSWRVLEACSLAVVARLRATVAALVAGISTSTAWFAEVATLMRGSSRGGEAGGGPVGGGESAAGWVDGQGSSPVEGEATRGASSEWVDGSFRRLVAVESGVRAGWVLFLVRVAVRGLGRGETAGVGLDGSAGVSSGGASSGMDSESRTVSSSSTMTCGCEEEAELAWGRGGEGIRDAASDKVEWTEASEASDLAESSEVAEGEVSRGGGACVRPCLRGVVVVRMVWFGGLCLWVGRVV